MSADAPAAAGRPVRRPGAAVALFFLAPLVAEFLLGNLPITFLPALVLLAPLYGGGALLIRETARRQGLVWPGIVILGLAYGVFEEVFTTQSLFNPNYLGLRLLDYGYLPALGMGAWWTVFVLPLHMIWSTCVPIALVEALTPAQRRTPWLGPVGLTITAVLFVLGSTVLAAMEMKKGFIASPLQFAASALVIGALIVIAFVAGRKPAAASSAAVPPPAPWLVGTAALVAGVGFFAISGARKFLPPAIVVPAILLLLASFAAVFLRWSRRPGWSDRHRLGLAAGFLLTYAGNSFLQVPSVGKVSPAIDHLGDVVFTAGALVLLWRAIARVKTE